MHDSQRVLLITTPWMTPNLSALALGLLRPILEQAGIATDTLYGSVLFPRTDSDHTFLERHGQLLFARFLYPEVPEESFVDSILARYLDDIDRNWVATKHAHLSHFGVDEAVVRAAIRADIARAGICLDRCFARATARPYDVVGFSLTFETQVPAALALARRLKAHNPGVKIIFGGAACVEEQADGLVASFPILDAVCHTEGESVIVPLIRALRGELALSQVPGIAFRGADDQPVHTPSPTLLRNLDGLPLPQYDDFVAQVGQSEWADLPLKLFFETSRGCWWGQKHLCTFCGLNGEGLAFRAKSGPRAFAEIRQLYESYPQARFLQATDNILDMKYFDTLLPLLARLPRQPDRPLRMFFEVKSNMKPQQVALLAAAGIDGVQPGIESFSDHVLKLMDKGCTALGQVQFIKWAHQEGIELVYNILFGSPGEQAAEYRKMIELLPYIAHLPPPVGITRLELMRFSPYFQRWTEFNITNVRPKKYYADLYRQPGVDFMRISYEFDFDHPSQRDEELQLAYRDFALAVIAWQRSWKTRPAFFIDRGSYVLLYDRRDGEERIEALCGVAAELYRYLDSARSFEAISRHFAGADPLFLRGLLERWHHRRFIYSSPADQHLAVLPQRRERPRDIESLLSPTAAPSGTARRRLPLSVVAP